MNSPHHRSRMSLALHPGYGRAPAWIGSVSRACSQWLGIPSRPLRNASIPSGRDFAIQQS